MTNIQTGDRGQRYEVTFYSSSEGEWTVLGWSVDLEGAIMLANIVQEHPVWIEPRIRDRNKNELVQF